MLQDHKQAVHFLAYLESISSLSGWTACSFTADVEEDGPGLIVPIGVIEPVALSEVAGLEEVEVVELLSEVLLNKTTLQHLIVDGSLVALRCKGATSS